VAAPPGCEAVLCAAAYTPRTGVLVFEVGGNKYRLIARVDFEEQLLYIERIMTHEQYAREVF
jgi:mRNA-degrading endonuclease HigB of HigAB toxin-antitoxin module